MRISYTEDEDFPGQFALWQANCRRSLKSKAGQAALRRLEAALLAMPEKRLIKGALIDSEGGVCALGALAQHEHVAIPAEAMRDEDDWDDDEPMEEFGEHVLKLPRLVAWQVVCRNDIHNDIHYKQAEGPNPRRLGTAGYTVAVPVSPEKRYEDLLAWVQKHLTPLSEGQRPEERR